MEAMLGVTGPRSQIMFSGMCQLSLCLSSSLVSAHVLALLGFAAARLHVAGNMELYFSSP